MQGERRTPIHDERLAELERIRKRCAQFGDTAGVHAIAWAVRQIDELAEEVSRLRRGARQTGLIRGLPLPSSIEGELLAARKLAAAVREHREVPRRVHSQSYSANMYRALDEYEELTDG